MPKGRYIYKGGRNIYDHNLSGEGVFIIDGYEYPVFKKLATNILWQGELKRWDNGDSNKTRSDRVHIPIGASFARIGFKEGCFIQHIYNSNKDIARIQRYPASSEISDSNIVMNLSAIESSELAGEDCVVQINARHGETCSNNIINIKVLASEEPEQSINSDTGYYTNGNIVILDKDIVIGNDFKYLEMPYFFKFTPSKNITQLALLITFRYKDIADSSDYIDIRDVAIYKANTLANLINIASILEQKAFSRYQSSYPLMTSKITKSTNGSLSGVCVTNGVNNACRIYTPFRTNMAIPPTVYMYSTESGKEGCFYNITKNKDVYGYPCDVSKSGVTFTNNNLVDIGDMLYCHFIADANL